ncbi:hypothetical protein KSP39_PZI008552 [Platanthera zijinensis]|uniref:AT-hook motif nuclear-localized protein n=1 Tax=Platanthera zijinensis TaxID=2320716 RepID=A0AAP0BND3_9ASPA
MEGREGMKPGGLLAAAAEGGGSYQKPQPGEAPVRSENPSKGVISPAPPDGSNPHPHQPVAAMPTPRSAETTEKKLPAQTIPSGFSSWPGSISVVVPAKKKRGRPRKYAQDGTVMLPLNPTPISTSPPPGQHSAPAVFSLKRGRGRPSGFLTKHHPRVEMESLGEMVAYSAGANFTPHIITVAAGEDVTMKIISFSQLGPRAICILSANGVISNVTLRQPDSSGGTLTYEGRFELLSLSGSFMPNENGGTKSRSGGMSVSLASPDGRVVGGGVAGLLVAASPVQVVVGSFLPSYQLEQNTKKPKLEISVSTPSAAAVQKPATEMDGAHNGGGGQTQQFTYTLKPNLTISSSFKGENWSSLHSSAPDSRKSATDINISLPGG